MARPFRKPLLLAALAAVPVISAAVAFAAPADTITQRQARLKQLGASFKTMNDELRQSSPDAAKVKASMAVLRQSSLDLPKWFPAGTGPEAGVKTKAKAEIWADKAGFATDAKSFALEVQKLQGMANANDFDSMKVQAKTVGQTCGTCHTSFRVKDPA
jgi:cytochrome c556